MPTYQISGTLQITDKGVLVMVRYRQASECRQQYKAPACLPPLLPPLPLPPLVLLSCRSSRLYFLPRMCGGPPAAQRTVARLAAHPLWRCVSIIRRAPQWLDPPSPLCPAPAALPYSRCHRGRRQRRRPHSYRVCEAHLRGGGRHPHASLPVSALSRAVATCALFAKASVHRRSASLFASRAAPRLTLPLLVAGVCGCGAG